MADTANSQNSTVVTDTATTTADSSKTSVTEAGFCSADERVSTHTCNSIHPSITMDYYGNRGIAWQDNRDGDFEIYLKFIATLQSTDAQAQSLSSFYDPKTGRVGSFKCSGVSGFSGFSGLDLTEKELQLLNSRCIASDNADNALLRFSDGKIDVNHQLTLVYLTGGQGTDFIKSGVNSGASILIETGLNANKTLLVVSSVSDKTIRLSYDPSLVSDSGFIYSLTSNPQFKLSTCELRLTCENGASLFPDIVADRQCRWHVVYQDDKSGNNEIYYIQVGPPEKVLKTCKANKSGVLKSGGGFGSLPSYVPNKTYIYTSKNGTSYYQKTGSVGDFFAYGNRSAPLPEGTGVHVLFRDWYDNNGKWVGLSKKSDLPVWMSQSSTIGNVPSPITFQYKTSFTEGGEFGSVYDFNHLAFQVQAPPDLGLDLRTVVLPIFPRCTPPTETNTLSSPPIQDLIEAPKKPLPPTFVDPVDISSLLTSPYVTFTSEPSRFTLEGDNSGTVYTNVILQDASGELSRLLFKKDISSNLVKFILGMTTCGHGNCAVKVSSSSESIDTSKDNRYNLRLQVWQGPDYRLDKGFIDSASTEAKKLLLDKEFYFDPNENFTTFVFEPNEVSVPRGTILYFSVIPSENSDYAVMAKGPGTSIWSSDNSSGNFNQYNVPYTLPPYQGLSAQVYYDGYLDDIPNDTEVPITSVIKSSSAGGVIIDDPIKLNLVPTINISGRPNGVAYLPSSKKLIVSEGKSVVAVDFDGTKTTLFTDAGLPSEITFYSIWEDNGKAKAGTTYIGGSGYIGRINPDETIEERWVTFDTNGSIMGMCIDLSGNWGGDLLVIVGNPNVIGQTNLYRVDPDTGQITFVVHFTVYVEQMLSLPVDDQKYGPYSGKLILGSHGLPPTSKAIVILDKNGSYTSVVHGVEVENLLIVPPNSHMYLVDWGLSKIFGVHKSEFVNDIGDIAISSEYSGAVYVMKWNGEKFEYHLRYTGGHFEQMNFAPYGIYPLCGDQEECESTDSTKNKEERTELEICNDVERFVFTPPIRLTNSIKRNSEHPRLAITSNDNIWVTFHSDRDGGYDIYASRFSSSCDVWNASATGGDDIKVSEFSRENRRAMFPKIAVAKTGRAHIAFQGTDENGKWQVFYAHSTGGNTNFSDPIQITKSSTGALMPDIAISYEGKSEIVTVVWHDDRSGKYQIYAAQKKFGLWRSSFQDGSDIRITNSIGSDMFPRIKADDAWNLRVVFHSDRTGRAEVFMSTYVASLQTWSSTGTDQSDVKVSTGPKNSLFPDLDTDRQGGVAIAWNDDRHVEENPDLHEEIYSNYCASLSHVGGPHFPPLIVNDEVFLDRDFAFINCNDLKEISLTNTTDVCLKIRAPGATFWRAANAGEPFSDWTPFKPNVDLETMTVPWNLTCGNGLKEVCVQVQNQDSVGFPLCKSIALVSPPIDFDIQFYADRELTIHLPNFDNRPAIKAGNTWIRIASPKQILNPPTFDVVHQGYRIATNQKTEEINTYYASGFSGFSGFSGTSSSAWSGIFGSSTISGVSGFSGAFTGLSGFSAAVMRQFIGKFAIHKDDGYNYKDGLARIIVKEHTVCDNYNDIISRTAVASCQSEKELPAGPAPVYAGTSGLSGPSGFSGMHGPYNPSTASMYISITRTFDSGQLIVNPAIDIVPYKITIGAIAQPFLVGSTITTNLNIEFKGGRRRVPDWLSSFQSRRLRVDLIENLLTTPTVIGTAYLNALLLPEVDFDPITGLMIDPLSLDSTAPTVVQIGGNPTLTSGTVYGISFSDETYYPLLGTYGANAKYFVVAYGTSIVSGQSAYYYRDY